MRVDQYLPSLAPHDAIGRHTLQVRRVLLEAGYDSRIWAVEVHPALAGAADFFQPGERVDDGWGLLYQHSTNSVLAPWLAEKGGGHRLATHYHNITPSRYFERWDRDAARAMEQAREELSMLAPQVTLAMAGSGFNEQELRAAGYSRTTVCPLLVDLDEYHRPPRPKTLDRLRRRRVRSGTHWLFVGRFVPNKCQHDVIGAFATYRHLVDPRARLTLVGWGGLPRYQWALARLAHQLGIGASVEMISELDELDLLAYWAVADVFVCLSEHEGFCVPLLEAMELGVPVVAYAAAAVPETLGGAGLLVEQKEPEAVARAVEEACSPARREELAATGRARAADFSLKLTSARLLEAVGALWQ